jgi:hypothetical protein
MIKSLRRPLSVALGALATTTLGGCYYGDVGTSYASAGNTCSDSYYDSDPYAYDDGYGYDCYDGSDYGSGFVQIGFGGGWYDDYYYPGYGTWMYDNYRNRYRAIPQLLGRSPRVVAPSRRPSRQWKRPLERTGPRRRPWRRTPRTSGAPRRLDPGRS